MYYISFETRRRRTDRLGAVLGGGGVSLRIDGQATHQRLNAAAKGNNAAPNSWELQDRLFDSFSFL